MKGRMRNPRGAPRFPGEGVGGGLQQRAYVERHVRGGHGGEPQKRRNRQGARLPDEGTALVDVGDEQPTSVFVTATQDHKVSCARSSTLGGRAEHAARLRRVRAALGGDSGVVLDALLASCARGRTRGTRSQCTSREAHSVHTVQQRGSTDWGAMGDDERVPCARSATPEGGRARGERRTIGRARKPAARRRREATGQSRRSCDATERLGKRNEKEKERNRNKKDESPCARNTLWYRLENGAEPG